jgi:integrase
MARARGDFGSIFRRRQADGRPVAPNSKEPCRQGYYVRLQVGGRQLWRKAGATRKEATDFLAKLRRDVFEETVLGVRPVIEIGFKKYAEDYLKHVERTHAKTTHKNTKARVETVVIPAFKDLAVSAVRHDDIVKFLEKRAKNGASIATRNRYAALLSAMFSRAVALSHARENPVDGIKRPAEPLRDVPYLALDQQATLVEKCAESIRPLVALALDTGMRRSELLALTWGDSDLTRGVVTIRRSKNGEPREVPVRARSLKMLEDLRKRRVVPMQGPDRVFAWIPESFPSCWNDLYHDAVKAAELPHLRFHDLRHLAAVNLTRAGVPLSDVGKFLGHRTLTMVLRYARHSPKDSAFRALDALEAYHAAAHATATLAK